MNMKYQELDLAFDALDEELKETQKEVIKVNVSTSCDDLVELSHPTTCHHTSPSCSKTNHDREKQLEKELESMTKCMFNVTRGEYLHTKNSLLQCKALFEKMELDPFPILRRIVLSLRSSRHASTRKWAHFVNIAK